MRSRVLDRFLAIGAVSVLFFSSSALGVAPAAAAAPSWAIVASPSPTSPPPVELTGVSCPTTTTCLAVGKYDHGAPGMFSERWDGTSWSVVPSPNPSGIVAAFVNGVSCVTATFCFAVGYQALSDEGNAKTLIEAWDGTTWSVVASPNTATNTRLQAVSCTSTTNCAAVGFYSSSGGWQSFAARWDGSSWSAVSTPDPPDHYASFSSVACVTSAYCLALGVLVTTDTFSMSPFAEQWDGTTWSAASTPPSGLFGVACVAVADCYGVGSTIEHWDGSTWTTVASGKSISAVSCSSSTDCLAVGATTEHWDGVTWTTVADHGYAAVSCASSTRCAAVNANQVDGNVITQWDGSVWSVADPAPGFSQSQLFGVSCWNSTSCLAVGRQLTITNDYGTLAERWNGSKWVVTPSPSPVGELWGVSCTSATNCFAVGHGTNDWLNGVIERWNGFGWAVVATPTASLRSVSCSSSTNCFAVGSKSNGGGTLPMAMRWDGINWSEVATQSPPGSVSSDFYGVSCSSATNCVAVGSFTANGTKPLIERWNGTAWSIEVAYANSVSLATVSCTSPTFCIAAGADRMQRWDGTQWSPSDYALPHFPNLSSVSCASATNCIAVGTTWWHVTRTLVEKWNGQSWTRIASANPSATDYYSNSYLNGVSCKAAVRCFAVGETDYPRRAKTLTERAP